MSEFKVTARHHGNSVAFLIDDQDVKMALKQAIGEAKNIFDYKDGSPEAPPTVSVTEIIAKD